MVKSKGIGEKQEISGYGVQHWAKRLKGIEGFKRLKK
jgi:hypothetical protein